MGEVGLLLILPWNHFAYIALAGADSDTRLHTHRPLEVSLVGVFPDPTPLFNVSRQRKTIAFLNIAMPRSSDQTPVAWARSKQICFTYPDVEFPSEY